MVAHSVPLGYRRHVALRRPKRDAHTGFIDQILHDDIGVPKKQRHTIQRIYDRLREERGFDGGYTMVRDYVHPRRLSLKEAFVPLAHPAGHAQADFGEAWAVIGGVTRKVRFFVVALPHSDAIFVKAYPAETAEAFCDGHVAAFAFFGGVPQSIVYDNTRLAVAKILGDGTRKRSTLFAALQSHYVFEGRYGRPGKGNDNGNGNGKVEGADFHGPLSAGTRLCDPRDRPVQQVEGFKRKFKRQVRRLDIRSMYVEQHRKQGLRDVGHGVRKLPDRARFVVRVAIQKVLPIARAAGVFADRGESIIRKTIRCPPQQVGEVVDSRDRPDTVPRHRERVGLRGLEVIADAIVDRLADIAVEPCRGLVVE